MARVALALVLALSASSALALELCLTGYTAASCAGSGDGLCGDVVDNACFLLTTIGGTTLYGKARHTLTTCAGTIDSFAVFTNDACSIPYGTAVTSIDIGTCKEVSTIPGFSSLIVTCPAASKSKCFPASATVELEDGSHKTMAEVQVGDKVLATTGEYSPVYMFSHRLDAAKAAFVTLEAGAVTLQLTPDHYVYVNGALAAASTVVVGDALTLRDGSSATVTKVHTTWAQGLYNPHTMHGDIVVNGVQTSTYTTGIAPALAHAALWPVRAMYAAGVNVADETTFAAGSQLLADALPNGKAKY